MTLTEYFAAKPRGSKIAMAKSIGISKTWLSLLISGREVPSAALAVAIHQYTRGRVRREELRPDLFGEVK